MSQALRRNPIEERAGSLYLSRKHKSACRRFNQLGLWHALRLHNSSELMCSAWGHQSQSISRRSLLSAQLHHGPPCALARLPEGQHAGALRRAGPYGGFWSPVSRCLVSSTILELYVMP